MFADNIDDFTLAGSTLSEVHEIKDLGILFDSKLSFSAHISKIIGCAKQRLFLLYKCFITKDSALLIKAFTIYVRPMLEYCSQVWSPYTKHDVDRIESVQRLFTKRLRGFEGLSYPERLIKANLNSLELRRVRADLILCYKMLHNLICIDMKLFFYKDNNDKTRGHSFKLRSNIPRLDTRKNFFGCRIVSIWNQLSRKTVEAQSADSFKKNLKTGFVNVYPK